MDAKIRAAILDDHPLFAEGYMSRLRGCSTVDVLGVTRYGEDMEQMLARCELDILLYDLSVSVSAQNRSPYPIFITLPRIRQRYPSLEILVVSIYNNSSLIHAVMESGASGYALKEDAYFLEALPDILHIVARGGMYMSQAARQQYFGVKSPEPGLTSRELQALSLCAAYPEATTAELAAKMEVAGSTLRNLLSGAYIALKVHSRIAAVSKAQQLGLILPARMEVDLASLGYGQLEKKEE